MVQKSGQPPFGCPFLTLFAKQTGGLKNFQPEINVQRTVALDCVDITHRIHVWYIYLHLP